MCRPFEFCWHSMIRKTFKNCVSLSSCRRTELRSQEVNKCSYLNNGVACVFESARVFAYVYVQLLLISLWLWVYNTNVSDEMDLIPFYDGLSSLVRSFPNTTFKSLVET